MNNKNTITIILALFICMAVSMPYFYMFNNGFSFNPQDWAALGAYFSGITLPFLAILNIYILLSINTTVSSFQEKTQKKYGKIIQKQNENIKNNDYQTIVNLESSPIECLQQHVKSIKNTQEILNHLRESDNQIMDDLKDLCIKAEVPFNIFDKIPYYENKLLNRNFDLHAFASSNNLTDIFLSYYQLCVHISFLQLQLNPNNNQLQKEYENTMRELAMFQNKSSYSD